MENWKSEALGATTPVLVRALGLPDFESARELIRSKSGGFSETIVVLQGRLPVLSVLFLGSPWPELRRAVVATGEDPAIFLASDSNLAPSGSFFVIEKHASRRDAFQAAYRGTSDRVIVTPVPKLSAPVWLVTRALSDYVR